MNTDGSNTEGSPAAPDVVPPEENVVPIAAVTPSPPSTAAAVTKRAAEEFSKMFSLLGLSYTNPAPEVFEARLELVLVFREAGIVEFDDLLYVKMPEEIEAAKTHSLLHPILQRKLNDIIVFLQSGRNFQGVPSMNDVYAFTVAQTQQQQLAVLDATHPNPFDKTPNDN